VRCLVKNLSLISLGEGLCPDSRHQIMVRNIFSRVYLRGVRCGTLNSLSVMLLFLFTIVSTLKCEYVTYFKEFAFTFTQGEGGSLYLWAPDNSDHLCMRLALFSALALTGQLDNDGLSLFIKSISSNELDTYIASRDYILDYISEDCKNKTCSLVVDEFYPIFVKYGINVWDGISDVDGIAFYKSSEIGYHAGFRIGSEAAQHVQHLLTYV